LKDADDIDFNEDDLFQDDDEQATMEPVEDEDTKDSKEKINENSSVQISSTRPMKQMWIWS